MGVVILSALLWRASKIGRRHKNYPLGLQTLPLLGNLHQMPKEKGHLQFQKWAEWKATPVGVKWRDYEQS